MPKNKLNEQKEQKHQIIMSNWSLGRIVGECKCKTFGKQYPASTTPKENRLLQIEFYSDYIEHLKNSR